MQRLVLLSGVLVSIAVSVSVYVPGRAFYAAPRVTGEQLDRIGEAQRALARVVTSKAREIVDGTVDLASASEYVLAACEEMSASQNAARYWPVAMDLDLRVAAKSRLLKRLHDFACASAND